MIINPNHEYFLPYIPLPQDKASVILTPIRNGLKACNFSDDLFVEGHIFTSKGQGLCVHHAAFTDPVQQDVLTSGVNFYYNFAGRSDEEILQSLALSGAPFNLIGNDVSASLYVTDVVSGKLQHKRVDTPIPYNRIPELLVNYRADISPQRIYRAKQGLESFVAFQDHNPLQLRLFAVDATRRVLVDQFGAALDAIRHSPNQALTSKETTEAVIQLLAAVILAHKGKFGEGYSSADVPLDILMQTASHQFGRYFKPELIAKCGQLAEDAYAILQQVKFSSFVIDYLEELYIAAYPSKEKRRWEGRYNTPLFLTQRIMANIPIETIRPTERVVVDMTCGVGNFLQAAYGRLSQMTDMQPYKEHLRDHIFGNDLDALTAQLASMSLLLTSFTDHWDVEAQDALHWTPRKLPTIIVGNPPFGGNRKLGEKATTTDALTGEKRRYEKANAFLEHAIQQLVPGGYLAMVMPQSFVASEAGPKTRKMLLEECDVLEIWELPGGIFRDATVRPMVVFAQKRHETEQNQISVHPVCVRTAQNKVSQLYQMEGVFTASSISVSQAQWGAKSKRRQTNYVMDYQLTLPPNLWRKIQQSTVRLDEIVDITQGVIVGNNPNRRRWTDYKLPKHVKWLTGVKESLPCPFLIKYGDETLLYPNEVEEPRKNKRSLHLDKEHILANDKVLLVSDPDASWGQRAIVAIERKGYYPSDSFWVLAPKPEVNRGLPLEILAAVVSWYVSNAWIVEHLKAPKINRVVVDTIPFPQHLSGTDCEQLTAAIHCLEAAAQREEKDPHAQQTIDRILKAAYGLDDVTFERLRMIAQWDELDENQLQEKLRKPLPNPAELLDVTGGVESVNAQEGTITLWLNGFPGLQTTPIADPMPGWMLRPGVSFRAEINQDHFRRQSVEGVTWFNIVPQEYTYLDEDELIDELDHTFAGIMSADNQRG